MLKFILSMMFIQALAFESIASEKFDLKKDFKGYVSIESTDLFIDYNAPKKDMPTVVLLNGLTYSTRQWEPMVFFLKKSGMGILRYDMSGMGMTLLRYGVRMSPYSYLDQVTELNALLKTLNFELPYNLVGLSYGGGIAASFAQTYPNSINKIVMMAPYTAALAGQDSSIKQQIAVTRAMFPSNPASNDQLYDYFLKQTVYTTYPFLEPIVLENPLKLEATFRLTQGIRKYVALDLANRFPTKSIYLVIAENDQYIPDGVLSGFWDNLPAKARAEKIVVANSEHKIPEAVPAVAAKIIKKIFIK
jgi:pimeloyl-ACP methyl ester carboxylesterase